MTETRKDKSDKDESLADSTMSLNIADFQKRCSELTDASESADEAPLEDEPAAGQASSA